MGFLWHIDPGTSLERTHKRGRFNLLASVLQAASLDFVFASERLLQSPGPFEGNRSVKSFIVLPRRTAVFSRANLEQLASAAACASFTLVITCASLLIAGKDTSVQLH